MAAITLNNVSMDAMTAQYAPQITGLFAGEALFLGAACYIKASDGLVYLSDGAADHEHARSHGFTGRKVAIGEPVTLFGVGARFHYAASGLVPGAQLFMSGVTPGELATAASVGDSLGMAFAANATDVVVARLPLAFS
jgi:hypothetical protein